MSRRDTIVIAVLINAGLLVVLFSTALKSNTREATVAVVKEKEEQVMATAAEIPIERTPVVSNSTQDEVDQLLRQFAATTNPAESAPAAPTEAKSDFAQDLNAFTSPTTLAAAPEPAPNTPSTVEVIVKKGDVLEKIARSHHTSVDSIMKINHLSSTRLKIGQVLKISEGSQSKKAEVHSGEAKYYTVKNGDNPWTIAVKNHMKVEELLRLNHLDAEKAKRLKPGDQLRIR